VSQPPVTPNPWQVMGRLTSARIALGRAGVSLPTAAQLALQLAHAQARDAVHLALDGPALQAALAPLGLETLLLHSAAADRHVYLQRPDLGRRLSDASRQALLDRQPSHPSEKPAEAPRRHDIAFVIADGLSAPAIAHHALPLLTQVLALLKSPPDEGAQPWSVAPLVIVEQGRVAVADEVGEWLGARAVVILIGERPGLSSPDSLGLYLTWMPRVGLTDASRNCISNVRSAGLGYEEATRKLGYLLGESRRRQLSGVGLKEDIKHVSIPLSQGFQGNR